MGTGPVKYHKKKFNKTYKTLYYTTLEPNEVFYYMMEGLRLISLLNFNYWVFTVKRISEINDLSIIEFSFDPIPPENIKFISEEITRFNRSINDYCEKNEIDFDLTDELSEIEKDALEFFKSSLLG